MSSTPKLQFCLEVCFGPKICRVCLKILCAIELEIAMWILILDQFFFFFSVLYQKIRYDTVVESTGVLASTVKE